MKPLGDRCFITKSTEGFEIEFTGNWNRLEIDQLYMQLLKEAAKRPKVERIENLKKLMEERREEDGEQSERQPEPE